MIELNARHFYFFRPRLFKSLFVCLVLFLMNACLAGADIITLKDGTSLRCEVMSDAQMTETGEKYIQIRVDNAMVWLKSEVVAKIEETPESEPAGSELHNLMEKLRKEGKAFFDMDTQLDFTSAPGAEEKKLQLTVKEVRGWIYIYENRQAMIEGKRAPLRENDAVPVGYTLVLSPNSRATLNIGKFGEIGLRARTQIRFDKIAMDRTQSFSLDMQVSNGAVWFRIGLPGVKINRLILSLNAAKSVIQNGTIYIESTERTGGLNVTYIGGEGQRKLNFWRKTDGPYVVSEGEMIKISPATNRLQVEASQRIDQLRQIIENWYEWEPDPLAVDLNVMIPPLELFSGFGAQPALHPYRIPIGKSMILPPETRSLGEIISRYKEGLEQYHYDTGKYPSAEHGLEALVQSFDEGGWNGPYIAADLPRRDFWGKEFVYEVYVDEGKEYADVRSMGPNGKDDRGLEDDIR